MPKKTKAQLLQDFHHRKDNPPKKVRNEDLYAGSSMYFYCYGCSHESEVCPENYDWKPSHTCSGCRELQQAGLMDEKHNLTAEGKSLVPRKKGVRKKVTAKKPVRKKAGRKKGVRMRAKGKAFKQPMRRNRRGS